MQLVSFMRRLKQALPVFVLSLLFLVSCHSVLSSHDSLLTENDASFLSLPAPSKLKFLAANPTTATQLLASSWNPAWPNQRVENEGTTAVFSPVANNRPVYDQVAFAIYRLNTDALKFGTLEDRITCDWVETWEESLAPLPGRLWIGMANWEQDRFDWYRAENPRKIQVSDISAYLDQDGGANIVLVVGSSHEVALERLGIDLKGPGAADWAAYGRDMSRQRDSAYSGPASTPGEKWAFVTGSSVRCTPVIAEDGTIYLAGRDHKLYAIDQSGNERWSLDMYTRVNWPADSTMIDSSGKIYYSSETLGVLCINCNGEVVWRFDYTNMFQSAVSFGSQGIIVNTSDHGMLILGDDGSLKARITDGSRCEDRWLAAYDVDGNCFYIDNNSQLVSYDEELMHRWTYRPDLAFRNGLSVRDDKVTIALTSTAVHAVRSDGTEKWIFPASANSDTCVAIGQSDETLVASGNSLISINADGGLNWEYETSEQYHVGTPMLDNENNVYFGTNGSGQSKGYVYSLSSGGTFRWKFLLPDGVDEIVCPILDSSGTLYVGCIDGNLYALSE